MSRPTLPEGHTVKFEYDEVQETLSGRVLIQPHRRTTAYVLNEHEDLVATGHAICRSGPAMDENDRYVVKFDGTVIVSGKYDNFAKQIGRDIALGRALKSMATLQKPSADIPVSVPTYSAEEIGLVPKEVT